MIELRNVTKTYRTKAGVNTILDRVNLRFPEGQNVAIVGRNGAGKSTLLRTIAGVELPDSGTIRRTGRVSWPLGFSGGFNGSLSGEENCRFVARIYGEDCARVTDYAYDFAEIGDYFHMPVRTYSSGMKARLAFGLSMAIDFDVYLIDEVTAVGDKRFRKKCREVFAARSERASLIMVSHSAETVREYCQSAVLLHDGELCLYEDVGQALKAHSALQGKPPRGATGRPAGRRKGARRKGARKKAPEKQGTGLSTGPDAPPRGPKKMAAKSRPSEQAVEQVAAAAALDEPSLQGAS